jgi:hypothetical protein
MNARSVISRPLRLLSDQDLIGRLYVLATREREATSALVEHLAEMDARRLYLSLGHASLFSYCTRELLLSEQAAFLRIAAARAVRRFPPVLRRLREGSVHLTSVSLLAPHLTEENHERLLKAARHRTPREVEELVATIRPLPEVPATIRRISAPGSGTVPAGSGTVAAWGSPAAHRDSTERPVVAPLAPGRYRVQFTASAELCGKLRRAQDLLRHQIPDGDPAAVFDRALTVLLEQLERKKTGATARRVARRRAPSAPEGPGSPKPRSRYIPAEVRRAVWARDGGRCAFTGRDGHRCEERGKLEFRHVEAYARRGEATERNISLRCRAHNGHESERVFGEGRRPALVREKGLRWGRENRRVDSGLCLNRVCARQSPGKEDSALGAARAGRDGLAAN